VEHLLYKAEDIRMANSDTINTLQKPIQYLKGIGEARARLFNRVGIFSVNDLLEYYPRQYEDRTNIKKINTLLDGEQCGFIGTVVSKVTEKRIRRGLSIYKVLVNDGTGVIAVTFFNQDFVKRFFEMGTEYSFFGKIVRRGTIFEAQSPAYEAVGRDTGKQTGRILPVYSSTAKLTQNIIREAVRNSFALAAKGVLDVLPSDISAKYNLTDKRTSLTNIHFPNTLEDTEKARFTLVFEEFYLLQLGLLRIKENLDKNKEGIRFERRENIDEFLGAIPFKLTDAQVKVYDEIKQDMESNKVMNRLVQGDVGSGKTIVAAMALFKAVRNGYQGALMVPTEILAEQHFESLRPLMEALGIKAVLITGSMKASEKKKSYEMLAENTAQIAIGTHALIEDSVVFCNLGLVITDEQHRFGVRQRAALTCKGNNPDVLVMTATPIPRTLALILYGDLDISIIDQLPPGRKSIKTYSVNEGMRGRIYNFIREKVKEGRQVYIVCPLIEESEAIEAVSAEEHAEKIAKEDFKDLRVGLIHGKIKAKEKDSVMHAFIKGDIDILVSTTVIEVGVNVPNATLMVIENSERFGLAQLHQLRGRVGRGEHQSYCVLFNQSKSKISAERMKIMEHSTDGFKISEKDLEIRGPGEFFGTRQHGIPEFKIANIYNDMDILKLAQSAAVDTIKDDPDLIMEKNSLLKQRLDEDFSIFSKNLGFV